MGRLHRFWSLPRREKKFFCEAGILLLLANLCVKALAFRHIDSFLRGRWNDRPAVTGPDEAGDSRLINLSLARAANLFPWESLCLSRSVAAFIMLRRRGIPAILFAGVKVRKDNSLSAHAWVHTGREAIEGNSENSTFTIMINIGKEPFVVDPGGTALD